MGGSEVGKIVSHGELSRFSHERGEVYVGPKISGDSREFGIGDNLEKININDSITYGDSSSMVYEIGKEILMVTQRVNGNHIDLRELHLQDGYAIPGAVATTKILREGEALHEHYMKRMEASRSW